MLEVYFHQQQAQTEDPNLPWHCAQYLLIWPLAKAFP